MLVDTQRSTAATPKSVHSAWLVGAVALWFAGIFLLLLGLAMRRTFNHDEHQFVVSAALIAREGLLPYRDFPYFHVPTLSLLYALVYQFTDFLLLGARWVSVVASWLLMVLLMGTALLWLHVLRIGVRIGIAVLLTLLLISTPSFLHASGAAWNHDVPILLTLVAAMLQATWLKRDVRPIWWLLPIGLLLGVAAGMRSTYVLTVPVFAIATLVGLGWRRRPAWVALIWLGGGVFVGLIPVLYLFWQAPSEFVFGNLTYAQLNTAAYTATYTTAASAETFPMTLPQKLAQTIRFIGLEAGNLLLVAVTAYALWRVRRQIVARTTPELSFLLLLVVSLLAGAFAPTPLQLQYIYALFPTFALLFLAALARDAQPQNAIRFVTVAAVIAVLFAAPRHIEGAATVFVLDEWIPLKVHSRGEYATSLAKQAPIVTLAPIYALEGNATVDVALATGPFGWRVAPLLEPSTRARFGIKGAAELLPEATDALPRAILTGIHDSDADLERPLLDYAQVHGYAPLPLPGRGTLWVLPQATWQDTIALAATMLPSTPLTPGEPFVVTFHLQAIKPLSDDLNVLVRLIGADGQDLLRSEGWPWGRPTSTWAVGDVWPDGHSFTIPTDAAPGPYRLEIAFYDPVTLEFLDRPATAGYIVVDGQTPPTSSLRRSIAFDDGIALLDVMAPEQPWTPGEQVVVHLTWQATTPARGRYTTFVHLVGAGGLAAQYDHEPLGGFYPTSDWVQGVAVTDAYPLALPADLPAGDYQLFAGLYDPATGQRLSWLDRGEPAGDAFLLATVHVR